LNLERLLNFLISQFKNPRLHIKTGSSIYLQEWLTVEQDVMNHESCIIYREMEGNKNTPLGSSELRKKRSTRRSGAYQTEFLIQFPSHTHFQPYILVFPKAIVYKTILGYHWMKITNLLFTFVFAKMLKLKFESSNVKKCPFLCHANRIYLKRKAVL
jgi:hypothetical protein